MFNCYALPSGGCFWGNHRLQPGAAVARQRNTNHKASSSMSWLPGAKRAEGADELPEVSGAGCDAHPGEKSVFLNKGLD